MLILKRIFCTIYCVIELINLDITGVSILTSSTFANGLMNDDPRVLVEPLSCGDDSPSVCFNYTLSNNWIKESSNVISPELRIPIIIALKIDQTRIDQLEQTLYNVSNPLSKEYGRKVSQDEIKNIVQAPKSSILKVISYLEKFGITRNQVGIHNDYIYSMGSIQNLEALFHVKFQKFIQKETRSMYIRAEEPYTLPQSIAKHIEMVSGINHLPSFNSKKFLNTFLDTKKTNESVKKPTKNSSKSVPNSPSILIPTSWRGKDVSVMAALRCLDGSFRQQSKQCTPSIRQVFVSVYPTRRKLVGKLATFKNYDLFSAPSASCKPCYLFSEKHFSRGQSAKKLCQIMQDKLNAPNDTLYCHFEVKNVTQGTPSHVNVTVVYEDDEISKESECLEGISTRNCSKEIIPMPDVTPALLHELYNVSSSQQSGKSSKNKQCVVEFLEQYYSHFDLETYFNTFNLPKMNVNKVIGTNNQSIPGAEATLDIQVIMGMAPNVSTWFWYVGGLRDDNEALSDSNQEPFLKWLLQLNSMEDPPLVHSVSYGDDESHQPKVFTKRVNIEFMKAGLRGISLLFAAGDDGVGGQTLRTEGPKGCDQFHPEFPAGSPYITSIGGTILGRPSDDGNGPLKEVVSDVLKGSMITSGGGFSNRFLRPSYQNISVTEYLQNESDVLPPQKFWNQSGRGYPDVSAIATHYLIMLSPLGFVPIGGTSASTPTVSALVSLLNDIRFQHGLPPLGFLNPLLYQLAKKNPNVFNDVRSGSNNCSCLAEACCPYGFPAARGWDASSGLGTLNFSALAPMMKYHHILMVHEDNDTSILFSPDTKVFTSIGVIIGMISISVVWFVIVSSHWRKRNNHQYEMIH